MSFVLKNTAKLLRIIQIKVENAKKNIFTHFSCLTLRKKQYFCTWVVLVRLGYSSIKKKNRGTLPLPMAGHNNGKWNDHRLNGSS